MNKRYNLPPLFLGVVLAFPVIGGEAADFSKWQQQQQGDFQEYRDVRDKEFVSMLEQQWEQMQVMRGISRDKTPKPTVLPKAQVKPKTISKTKDRPSPLVLPVIDKKPIAQKPVTIVPLEPVLPPTLPANKSTVQFFGHTLKFTLPDNIKPELLAKINQDAVGNNWKALSQADYAPVLKQLENYNQQLALGDWGKVQLVWQVADAVKGISANEKTLLTWFFLVKQGFDARAAFDSQHVYLLLPSKQPLYETSFFNLDGTAYYWLNLNDSESKPQKFYTYKGRYQEANQSLDMNFAKTIKPVGPKEERQLTFTYGGKSHELTMNYSGNRIEYFKSYPQLDLALYFNSEPDPMARAALISQLRPLLENKNEKEAVNLLLRFVQTAFSYETDDEQFGEENYLVPEETLYYAYSDCEDRGVMFSWLVRNLLGLDVVGLSYPGHVATAVAFKGAVAGDELTHEGRRYVIADPTYINAVVGMTMPQYQGVKPKVVTML